MQNKNQYTKKYVHQHVIYSSAIQTNTSIQEFQGIQSFNNNNNNKLLYSHLSKNISMVQVGNIINLTKAITMYNNIINKYIHLKRLD